jgi:hypothetical protein
VAKKKSGKVTTSQAAPTYPKKPAAKKPAAKKKAVAKKAPKTRVKNRRRAESHAATLSGKEQRDFVSAYTTGNRRERRSLLADTGERGDH